MKSDDELVTLFREAGKAGLALADAVIKVADGELYDWTDARKKLVTDAWQSGVPTTSGWTNAPEDYDACGTYRTGATTQVGKGSSYGQEDGSEERRTETWYEVRIRPDSLDWQVNRYRSGWHTFEEQNPAEREAEIIEQNRARRLAREALQRQRDEELAWANSAPIAEVEAKLGDDSHTFENLPGVRAALRVRREAAEAAQLLAENNACLPRIEIGSCLVVQQWGYPPFNSIAFGDGDIAATLRQHRFPKGAKVYLDARLNWNKTCVVFSFPKTSWEPREIIKLLDDESAWWVPASDLPTEAVLRRVGEHEKDRVFPVKVNDTTLYVYRPTWREEFEVFSGDGKKVRRKSDKDAAIQAYREKTRG